MKVYSPETGLQALKLMESVSLANNGYIYLDSITNDLGAALEDAGLVVCLTNGRYMVSTKKAQQCLAKEPFGTVIGIYRGQPIVPDYDRAVVAQQERLSQYM
jgi:hypothetical protein